MITVGFNKVFVDTNIALGNHMFQYAICRLVAKKNNYNFYIPYSGHLKDCFPNIDLGVKDGAIKYEYHEDNLVQVYNPNIFNLPDFTHINGYLQTEKYFQGFENDVKSWFSFDMDGETKSVMDKYPVDNFCYIHIRGGDNKLGTNNWLLPKEYYLRAIEKIKKIKKDIKFVIITDDIELSTEYFPDIDVLSNSVMVDFKSIYYSKYSIISNSSYSWWAAWLSEKKLVIAPNNWLNYNMPEKGFYPVDIKTDKFTYI